MLVRYSLFNGSLYIELSDFIIETTNDFHIISNDDYIYEPSTWCGGSLHPHCLLLHEDPVKRAHVTNASRHCKRVHLYADRCRQMLVASWTLLNVIDYNNNEIIDYNNSNNNNNNNNNTTTTTTTIKFIFLFGIMFYLCGGIKDLYNNNCSINNNNNNNNNKSLPQQQQ
jgi:hypothetical protein